MNLVYFSENNKSHFLYYYKFALIGVVNKDKNPCERNYY